MTFWWCILASDILIPTIMVIFGAIFRKRPPKKINSFYGYRTSMSMKTYATWEFAHKYCGSIWVRAGLIILPLSVIPMLLVINRSIDTIAIVGNVICFAQLILLILTIIPVEKALKRNFDEHGSPR